MRIIITYYTYSNRPEFQDVTLRPNYFRGSLSFLYPASQFCLQRCEAPSYPVSKLFSEVEAGQNVQRNNDDCHIAMWKVGEEFTLHWVDGGLRGKLWEYMYGCVGMGLFLLVQMTLLVAHIIERYWQYKENLKTRTERVLENLHVCLSIISVVFGESYIQIASRYCQIAYYYFCYWENHDYNQ